MRVIHQTPTCIFEAVFTRDTHTRDLYRTWPTMATPRRRRVAQFNLPHGAPVRHAAFIPENANGPA